VDPDPQAATTTTLPTNNNFEIVRDMAISSAKNLASITARAILL
jgi:hypothetical protein